MDLKRNKIKFQKNLIFNTDCMKIFEKMPRNSIDIILSDPPFGQNLKYGLKKIIIQNDKNLKWLMSFAYNAYRILKNNSFCILFWQWRTFHLLEQMMLLAGFNIRTVAIWDKRSPGLGQGLTEQYELIIFFKKGEKNINCYRGNIFSFSKITKNSKHPHQKPVNLLKEIILLSSKKNNIIFDPFMGTGSTLIACIETGRNYIGAEISKNYFIIAKNRINKKLGEIKVNK